MLRHFNVTQVDKRPTSVRKDTTNHKHLMMVFTSKKNSKCIPSE